MPLRLPFYRRISVKLTFAYLTVTALIMGATGLLNIRFTEDGYERLIARQFQSTLKVHEEFIDQVSLATETWAQHLASEPEVQGYFLSNSPQLMPEYIRQYESAGLLQFRTLLLSPKGDLLFDITPFENGPKSFASTEIVKNTIKTRRPHSAILHDGNQFTLFSVAATVLDNQLLGLVMIGKVLDQPFVEQVSAATGIDITVVRERAVMASTLKDGNGPVIDLPVPYLEYQRLLDQPGDSVIRTLFGETYFIAAKPLSRMDGHLPGSIFLAKSHGELDAIHKELLQRSMLIALCGMLAALLLGVMIYRYLRHIRQLSEATIEFSSSGTLKPVDITSNDEIGLLGRNFNQMLKTIKLKSQQLEQYSDTLEEKVNTRTQQLQQAMVELNKFSLAVEQSPVAVVITDLDGNVEYTNPHFTRTTGYSAEEIQGKNLRILKSGRTPDTEYEDLWRTITAGDVWRGEFYNRAKDGTMYWERTAITPIMSNGQVTHYLGMKEDISTYKEYEQTLLKQANFDALTELPNRILARDRLKQAIASCGRNKTKGALLFIDLDNFKRVNDTLGHNIGDKLLIEAGQRIASCIRQEDTTARLSGDEFLVIIGNLASEHDAEVVARHIINTLCQPLLLAEQSIVITASIGIAIFPDDSNDINELMRFADTAMYRAKAKGRNAYCFFTEDMNNEVTEHLKMENELRHAIENDKLELHFQPLTHLSSGRVYAAEALLRWNSQSFGPVSPARFIPLAEESDLIQSLGRHVLTRACEYATQWRQKGYLDLRVAVNISPLQLRQGNLVQLVADTLAETGLPATNLELEITESALLDDTDLALTTLNALRELGVSLSIDDFGTGYSSLSYLSRFPFDILKIDKSFIDRVVDDKHCRALTTGIIELAHNLEMSVVAEGVELEAQREFLRTHGCDNVQGYLLSRPVAPDELLAYLDAHPTT
jgi:diguanylate cyclase (GGDEF)-like protein/PAS domain S-box-containing protein